MRDDQDAGVVARELWDAIRHGDPQTASRSVFGLLDRGWRPGTVVRSVLAPAGRLVGARWERNEIAVADEHRATSVALGALALLEREQDAIHSADCLVVSAEGDWHTAAPRMFAARLRDHGVGVAVLPGPLPADHVREHVAAARPRLVAVSTTTEADLPGAAQVIEAVHSVGVPVVAGGSGFGPGPDIAVALGADAWAASDLDVVQLVDQPPEITGEAPRWERAADLQAGRGPLLDALTSRLHEQYAADLVGRHQAETLSGCIAQVVDVAIAAVLVQDRELLDRYRSWLQRVCDVRGLPELPDLVVPQVLAAAGCLPSGDHLS